MGKILIHSLPGNCHRERLLCLNGNLFICLFILPPVLHSRTMILASAPLFAQISIM